MRKAVVVALAILALVAVAGPAMANPNGSIVPMNPGTNAAGNVVHPW